MLLTRRLAPVAAASALGGSSNGRTADSDSASVGSNPAPPAKPGLSIKFRYLDESPFLPVRERSYRRSAGSGPAGRLPPLPTARSAAAGNRPTVIVAAARPVLMQRVGTLHCRRD